MDVEARYRALLAAARADGVRLRAKADVWHQRAIARALRVLTLGAQTRYLEDYVTTIGRSIYVTPDWEQRSAVDRYVTLCHELVHVRQFRRYGLVPMALAYLLLPLPFGLAWCRMRLEREAYEETVRVHYALCGPASLLKLRAHVVKQFVSGAYVWMWPFPRAVERWFDRLVASLR